MLKKLSTILFLCITLKQLNGQGLFGVRENNFLIISAGPQLSGIRTEDFVNSNVSPKFRFVYGKRINEKFDVELGVEGIYFKMILNQDRRNYIYWNSRLSQEVFKIELQAEKNIRFMLALGGGLFDNKYFNKLGFVGELGVKTEVLLKSNNRIVIYPNAIMGWDLYQGDNDIINGVLIGYSIEF